MESFKAIYTYASDFLDLRQWRFVSTERTAIPVRRWHDFLFQRFFKPELKKLASVKLNSSMQHFSELNLKTNPTKSSFIQFRLRQSISDNLTLTMDDTEIEELYVTKLVHTLNIEGCLGDCHVDSVCVKIASGIFVLREPPNKWLPSPGTGRRRITGRRQSTHLSHGLALWCYCAKTHLRKESFSTLPCLHFRNIWRLMYTVLYVLCYRWLWFIDL